ncbi:hypothetical protein FHS15_002630 [Paenibacillus castaneae]|uniref:hypothetical protein n=1 Tax=Paenibacillus castaneae TaxID=474957 RepID=UPI000C9BC011|nr:hypothetical protein [Paenibacillus castaneae]NIK77494.1 hypothetical protein [Paenibacillus castaneae]
MKNIAIGLLVVILISILIEPMTEMANVFREKIIVSTALFNACRAAKDRSLEYEMLRGLDAKIDEDKFKHYFADAFEDTLNVTRQSGVDNAMTFTSNDGKYNTFTVTLAFSERKDFESNQLVSEVAVKAESLYKFKTKYLKLAEKASKDVDYQIIGERKLILSVKH